MNKQCQECSTTFDARNSRAKYCSDKCRSRAHYTGKAARQSIAQHIAPVANSKSLTLSEAVSSLLESLGESNTARGVNALQLAKRLDLSDSDSAAGMAAVSKQLHLVLDALTTKASQVEANDPLTRLRRRYEQRRTEDALQAKAPA